MSLCFQIACNMIDPKHVSSIFRKRKARCQYTYFHLFICHFLKIMRGFFAKSLKSSSEICPLYTLKQSSIFCAIVFPIFSYLGHFITFFMGRLKGMSLFSDPFIKIHRSMSSTNQYTKRTLLLYAQSNACSREMRNNVSFVFSLLRFSGCRQGMT